MKTEEIANRERFKLTRPLLYNKLQNINSKFIDRKSIGIIRLEYDYVCNMRCEHCSIMKFQGKNNARKFTIEDVRALADQADNYGLTRFVITGGEPLIFKDLPQIIKVIDPKRFYINLDTNAYIISMEKAEKIKEMGIDRVQISIDSMLPEVHDKFRNKEGAWIRAIKAISFLQMVGVDVNITTVVTKERLYSAELQDFLTHFTKEGIRICLQWAKPVGAWEGRADILINSDDIAFEKELEKNNNCFNHLTPGYGLNMGCPAMKGIFTISSYGDVMPCPYMHISMGNFFSEPLAIILDRGMKYFKNKVDTCLMAEDKKFIHKYAKKTKNITPIGYKEFFDVN